ncbi:hypothetical protein FRC09_013618 [Ceratobasidium sp. 395]|nr:hypothetical protein FRC09_013618 [Ceratobasidium sp. 395]
MPRIPTPLPEYLQLKPRQVAEQRKRAKKTKAEREKAKADKEKAAAEKAAAESSSAPKKGRRASARTGGATNGTKPGKEPPKSASVIASEEDEDGEEEGAGKEVEENEPEDEGEEEDAPEDNAGKPVGSGKEIERDRDSEDDDAATAGRGQSPSGQFDDSLANAFEPVSAPAAGRGEPARAGDVLPRPDDHDELEPGIDDFDRPFAARELLEQNRAGFPPPPEFHQYFHLSALTKPPKHILVPPIVSVTLPHNAWRQLGDTRAAMILRHTDTDTLIEMKEQLLHALEISVGSMKCIMRGFASERSTLRQSLLQASSFLNDMPSYSDVACLLLTDIEAGIKDIFVVRCAKVLLAELDSITDEEAIAEVTRMASDDGLLARDLITIDSDNILSVDLLPTFPAGLQSAVGEATLIENVALSEGNKEREETMRLMRHILPSRGMGRNQVESRNRAHVALEHQRVRRDLEIKAPNAVHGLMVDRELPVSSVETPPRRVDDPFFVGRENLWRSVGPSVVRYTEKSPFSDGVFLPKSIDGGSWLSTADGPNDGPPSELVVKARERCRVQLREAWDEACKQEQKDWNKVLALANEPSQPAWSQTRSQPTQSVPAHESSPSLGGTQLSLNDRPLFPPSGRPRRSSPVSSVAEKQANKTSIRHEVDKASDGFSDYASDADDSKVHKAANEVRKFTSASAQIQGSDAAPRTQVQPPQPPTTIIADATARKPQN